MFKLNEVSNLDILMKAARDGDTETVTALLDLGIAVDAKDQDGDTALILAVKARHIALVEFLLNCGADINAKNNDGRTAFMMATNHAAIAVAAVVNDVVNRSIYISVDALRIANEIKQLLQVAQVDKVMALQSVDAALITEVNIFIKLYQDRMQAKGYSGELLDNLNIIGKLNISLEAKNELRKFLKQNLFDIEDINFHCSKLFNMLNIESNVVTPLNLQIKYLYHNDPGLHTTLCFYNQYAVAISDREAIFKKGLSAIADYAEYDSALLAKVLGVACELLFQKLAVSATKSPAELVNECFTVIDTDFQQHIDGYDYAHYQQFYPMLPSIMHDCLTNDYIANNLAYVANKAMLEKNLLQLLIDAKADDEIMAVVAALQEKILPQELKRIIDHALNAYKNSAHREDALNLRECSGRPTKVRRC